MSRAGFALITVLWLITALGAAVALELGSVQLGNRVSTNRLLLSRGRWGAEGCLAIVQARWPQQRLSDTATIDLGRGTRCAWAITDPTARINVNTTDAEQLRAAGWIETSVRALMEARRQTPFESVQQLSELPGYDSTLVPLVTVLGPGTINVSAAPRRVLLALPGMTPEAVDYLLYRRSVERAVTNLDELISVVSPASQASLMNRYADLARLTTFAAPVLIVRAVGWVEGFAPRANIEVAAVPLPERLAVVMRRMW